MADMKWWQWLGGVTGLDEDFERYRDQGGDLGYGDWMRKGRPKAGIVSPRTRAIEATPEYAQWLAQQQMGILGQPPIGGRDYPPPDGDGDDLPPNLFKTYEEALNAAPEGWEPELTETGYWSYRRVPVKEKPEAPEMPEGFYKTYKEAASAAPEGFKPVQTNQGYWALERTPTPTTYEPYGTSPYDIAETEEVEGQWNPYIGRWEEPAGYIPPYQQSQLDIQREQLDWQRELAQMQQQEQERQYRSQLMANPMSWLQYSAYAGETPVMQPWMKPLMSDQYQMGQELLGWQPGQATGQPMGSLPGLRTPSAQLWGRMGPTAQSQYMGYKQTRTGARPEETEFRLRSGAAPGGRYGGLRWMR